MFFRRSAVEKPLTKPSRERLIDAWARFRDDERATASGRGMFAATCLGIALALWRALS